MEKSQIEIKNLKEGDKIIYEEQILTIKNIETSNIGKHGKVKRRIEAISDSGEKKVIIRQSDDTIDILK